MDTLGSRIRKARKAKKITQTDIKNACGISSGNLSEIENDKVSPTSNALLSLKRFLGVSVDWLLTGEGEMFPPSEPDHKLLPNPMEFDVNELNDEQKELLMLFAHLNENQKYAVKEFIKYQFRQPQSNENLSCSPPFFPPTKENSSGGETA